MSVTIRPEELEDLAEALEVERLAFGSDEEPTVVEASGTKRGRSRWWPRTKVR